MEGKGAQDEMSDEMGAMDQEDPNIFVPILNVTCRTSQVSVVCMIALRQDVEG